MWMRTGWGFLVLAFGWASLAQAEFDHSHARLTAVLREHVSHGLVDYAGLHASPQGLAEYLDELAAVSEREFNSWVVAERLAYLINLYNAQVLQMVVEAYPVRGIRNVGGWFGPAWNERPVVRLFGARVTLEILERNYLRRHYAEPAIHLALVRATLGSPPLRSEAYVPDRLYGQFLDQGRNFLGTPPNNRIDVRRRRLHLSPIFRWYEEDFARKAGSIAAYVRIYLAQDVEEALRNERFAIRYTDYDWSLNDLNPKKKRPAS